MAEYRELVPEDIPGIVRLVRETGFPERSEKGWHWALFENPEQGDLPAGYAAEKDGQLVAMIGLQARKFHYGKSEVAAASGHTFISNAKGRGAGFALAKRALDPTKYAAIYSLNNNELAGRFHKRVGLEAWLGSSARKRMEWPVHSMTMAAGLVLSRLGRSEKMYQRLSAIEWFQAGARDVPKSAKPFGNVIGLDPANAHDADLIDAFDARIALAHHVSPVRKASTYAYQMSDPDAPRRSGLFGLVTEDGLEGLMQVIITKPNAFEPAELQIIDLDHLPGRDGARIVPLLINAARHVASKLRLSRVRLPYSDRFEPICFEGTGARFERRASYDTAHGRFAKGVEQLRNHWVPTGFEGDFYFALRVLPERRKSVQRKGPSPSLSQGARAGFTERRSLSS